MSYRLKLGINWRNVNKSTNIGTRSSFSGGRISPGEPNFWRVSKNHLVGALMHNTPGYSHSRQWLFFFSPFPPQLGVNSAAFPIFNHGCPTDLRRHWRCCCWSNFDWIKKGEVHRQEKGYLQRPSSPLHFPGLDSSNSIGSSSNGVPSLLPAHWIKLFSSLAAPTHGWGGRRLRGFELH